MMLGFQDQNGKFIMGSIESEICGGGSYVECCCFVPGS